MNDTTKPQINFNEFDLNSDPGKGLDFKSRLVDNLIAECNTDEQKWFVKNWFMYLNYHQTEDYVVNLEDIWEFIGFASKANSKKTLKNNFILGEDFKIYEDGRMKGKFTTETVMLNVNTFKTLSMLARTDHGKKIRKCRIKLEKIYNKLVQEDHAAHQALLEKKDNDLKLHKHNFLVEYLKYKKCIYFQKVISKDLDLIKIGSSQNIIQRNSDLQRTYGTDGIFLEVFECNALFRDIERNILNDPVIKANKHKGPLDNGRVSNEIIIISNDFSYEQLVTLVKRHISSINNNLENKRMELENQKYNIINKALDLKMSILEITNLLGAHPGSS